MICNKYRQKDKHIAHCTERTLYINNNKKVEFVKELDFIFLFNFQTRKVRIDCKRNESHSKQGSIYRNGFIKRQRETEKTEQRKQIIDRCREK